MREAALTLRALELKVPPLVLVAITAALMWLTARAVPGLGVRIPSRAFVAAGLVAAGLTLCALGIASFRRARTTVNPMTPEGSSSLVDSGPYAYTRNPMYLGMLAVLTGWAAWLGHALAAALLPAFVLYMNRFQIAPEEKAMAALFGADFDAYRARVRRWV